MDKSSLPAVIIYPKAINHIAVSVTNLDKAVKWYQEVFGFTIINGPVEFEVSCFLRSDVNLVKYIIRKPCHNILKSLAFRDQ